MAKRATSVITVDSNWWRNERAPIAPGSRVQLINAHRMDVVSGLPKIMTVKVIAQHFSFSVDAVYLWIKQGRLKAISIGGHKRIRKEDLAAFLISESASA